MTSIPILRCEGLRKQYGGIAALDDVSVSFGDGAADVRRVAIIAIVGPNGAGKTTLLNSLTGTLAADGGRVWLDKQNISRLAPFQIARLGLVRTFQEVRLARLISVVENVMLGRPYQKGEHVWRAVSRIGIRQEERRNRNAATSLLRTVGLSQHADSAAGALSYGEQKLLTLACCMNTEAHTLLLDEPVAGIHPMMTEQILDLFQKIREAGKRIVFIEHDLSFVRQVADRVILMDEGKVIASGEPGAVLDRPDLMEAYVS